MLARLLERGADLVAVLEVERDAAPVVRVERLHDDRDIRAARPRAAAASAVRTTRWRGHGQAEVAEDAVRLFLVGGDLDGDVARLGRDRRLDALLVLAVAELHEAVVVQAQPRDVALLGGAHERAGRRAELTALREVDELDELGLEVERRLVGSASPRGRRSGRAAR